MIDKAIAHLKSAGKGALMSKLDLSDAFRHILVHPDNWELLGSTWPVDINGTVYSAYFIDASLPFGLKRSPSLLLRYADTLAHVMGKCRVSPTWHYLEDFWTCGPPAPSTRCRNNLDHMLTICNELGFATNPRKTV